MKKINIYFKQFRFLFGFRILLSDVLRKLLDPNGVPGYSQTGEDKIIRHFLGDVKTGFYVEIGCNDPQKYSNTFALYKQGWKGLVIDANSKHIIKMKRVRVKDQAYCALVSNEDKEYIFTEFKEDLLSSVEPNHVHYWENKKGQSIIKRTKMISEPLDSIFNKFNVPYKFDLLSIDVEGHDFEVLSSLNLKVFRPTLIIIEMHDFDLLKPNNNKIYSYLLSKDFSLVGFVINNGYFLNLNSQF